MPMKCPYSRLVGFRFNIIYSDHWTSLIGCLLEIDLSEGVSGFFLSVYY